MSECTDEFSFILKPSTIQGVGVFATHPINQGTLLRLVPKYFRSRRLHSDQIPDEFKPYGIIENDNFYRVPLRCNRMEIGWYLNHSFTPNIAKREGNFYASQLIAAGEELLMDYNDLNEPEDKKEAYYAIIREES